MRQIAKIEWMLLTVWVLLSMPAWADAKPDYAGSTVAQATEITDTTALLVRDGGNYVKLPAKNLPAVVTYTPDSAFGPLPVLIVDGTDTVPATRLFVGCTMQWQWSISKNEEMRIVNIESHEDASILVEPHVCAATYSDTTATACGGLEWNGVWRDKSGDYVVTLDNADGCDSIRTLHLTVYNPVNTDTTAEAWDSLVWYGKTYKESGTYSVEKKDEHLCDYTHTLYLTIHTTTYETLPMEGCDSIVVDGKKYIKSGLYPRDTTVAADGNRTIRGLQLTIHYTTTKEQTVSTFDSYLSPQGRTYKESGDYTDTVPNVSGCDSIITTHLTVHTTSYDTLPMKGCDKMEYEGKTYTKSGNYNDTTVTGSGDRIIRTLALTIGHTTYGEESVYKNGSYTSPRGNTYTESGDYEEKITNAAGCDSIITIHLTIGNAVYDTVYFCKGYNREHEEQINELLIRNYLPYTYESPALVDYKDGVVLEVKADGVLVDLNRAEANLYNHYTGGLTPIETIAWSIRYIGESTYTPIVVEKAPQWIGNGYMAVQVRFLCGEIYTDALPMGVEDAQAEQKPVKRIENGRVVIIRGDAVYTPLGERIK